MAASPSLVPFLRAVAGARKGLRLYPPGSAGAGAAVARLRAALDRAIGDGLALRVRVARDGFGLEGGVAAALDQTLAGLRRDLQARGIGEFHIEPETGADELVAFLDLLNLPPDAVASTAEAVAFLRERGVTHIAVGGLVASVAEVGEGDLGGGTGPGDEAGTGSRERRDTPGDLGVAILNLVEERLVALAYDREALGAWLEDIAATRGVGALYEALRMLETMAEGAGDREVRTRTALDAALRLPERTLRPLLADWLLPRAGTDRCAFNLLAHMSENDLATVERLVPADQLMRLTAELLEFPWERGKRHRLLEAMTWRLAAPGRVEPAAARPVSSMDETLLAELRGEILEALSPDVLLERSVEVLLVLLREADIPSGFGSAADALGMVVTEALQRARLDLAARVLEEVERAGAPAGVVDGIRRTAAERAQVARLIDLLHHDPHSGRLEAVATYLRLAGPESVRTFVDLQAEQSDRRVRLLMSDALARLGAGAVPVLAARIADPRWHVARNVLYALGRIGPAAADAPIATAVAHSHPRVRREAIRTAVAVGQPVGVEVLGRLVSDPDPAVRRAAVSALGMPGNAAAIPVLGRALRDAREQDGDGEMSREILQALASIGTPDAVQALREIAGRRIRFWERAERRLRDLAVEVLAGTDAGEADGGR